AQAGCVLVCGGLKGVMEAAAKGAKSAGGLTVGILPGSKREEANPYIDIPIITGLGYARNKLVVKTGQVIIAIGGKYGTLSEIGFALGYGIPVIGLKTWELIRGDGKVDKSITYVNSAKEAVDLALKIMAKAEKPKPKTKERGI
ncbi:MAG: TIGR00725 family protein, partial [Candidatus Margulisiibacteriota bacterium]